MTNITNPRLLYFKAILFLITGLVSAALVILELPSVKIILLLPLAIWCFCRAYYFAFYVVEHYVDSGYRFSGSGSFIGYLLKKRRGDASKPPLPATANEDRPLRETSCAGRWASRDFPSPWPLEEGKRHPIRENRPVRGVWAPAEAGAFFP